MKSIKNAEISAGMRVLVRCDLDVPIRNGKVDDTFRLDHLLPTLFLIKRENAKSVIIGHIARPGGKYKAEYSTSCLKSYFDEELGSGNYELHENLRFDSGEKGNSSEYAIELAKRGDVFVNEAFANSHREHASMVSVPKLLPSYAGLRLIDEVNTLSGVLKNPKRPLVAIIGGAKVETKKPAAEALAAVADSVLIGGKVGFDWGKDGKNNLFFPEDYTGDKEDIGENTVKKYVDIVSKAGTVIWSGPLGRFEGDKYINGTKKIAEAVTESGAHTVVGGGDIIDALRRINLIDKINFVSVGGGAMLEFLIKGTLPALEVLGHHG